MAHPELVKLAPGTLALLCFHLAPGASNKLSGESALCSAPRGQSCWPAQDDHQGALRTWQGPGHFGHISPSKFLPTVLSPLSLPFIHSSLHFQLPEMRKTWQNIHQTISSGYFEGSYVGGNYTGFLCSVIYVLFMKKNYVYTLPISYSVFSIFRMFPPLSILHPLIHMEPPMCFLF